MAFNLPGCPTGWTEYTQATGRTIIGAGVGAGSTTVVGDVGEDKETSLKVSINPNASLVTPVTGSYLATQRAIGGQLLFANSPITSTVDLGPGTAGNMQPYVALLYCVKN